MKVKYRAWWLIWRKPALSIMFSSCVIMCTVFLIALPISCGLGTWDWEDPSPFFLVFFFCFYFCYFAFIFSAKRKSVSWNRFTYFTCIIFNFSLFDCNFFLGNRSDLCLYFSSLSANRSVKFSQFHLNFLLISQEMQRPFVQVSGRTTNAPPKLLSIISTLLPTCAKLSSTTAV